MKTLNFIILSVVLLNNFTFAQDSLPPQLDSLMVSPLVVNAGDSITITIVIRDDLSGIAGSGFPGGAPSGGTYASVVSPNYPNKIVASDWVHVAANRYITTVKVPYNATGGMWEVEYLMAVDIAGNSFQYKNNIDYSASFQVIPATLPTNDTLPPQLISFKILSDTVVVPDYVHYQLEAVDTQSGLYTTWPTQVFISSSSGIQKSVAAYWWNVGSGKWTGLDWLDSFRVGGWWKIDSLRLMDSVYNSKMYYNGIDYSADFYVIANNPDTVFPVFYSINIAPQILHRGDSITITLEMEDTGSGLQINTGSQPPSVTISNEYHQQPFGTNQWKSVGGNFYEGKAQISEYAINGIWYVRSISFADHAFNRVNLYSGQQQFSATFEIISDSLKIITGNILQDNGSVLADSKVLMIKQNSIDSSIFAMRVTTTDSTGMYKFYSEKRDSIIYVKAIPNFDLYPNQVPTYLDSTTLFQNASAIYVTAAQTFIDTFRTLPGINTGGFGFITGFVEDGAGKNGTSPVANLNLVLATLQGDPLKITQTNTSGYFEFENLPFGEYLIYPVSNSVSLPLAPRFNVTETSEFADLQFSYRDTYLELEFPASIKNYPTSEIQIFPNPVLNYIVINGIQEETTFRLYNYLGANVLTSHLSNINNVVEIKQLTCGIYLYEINGKTGKILIKKE